MSLKTLTYDQLALARAHGEQKLESLLAAPHGRARGPEWLASVEHLQNNYLPAIAAEEARRGVAATGG